MGSLYGFEIKSELPLRRLNRAPGTRGTLLVEEAPEPLTMPSGEPNGVLEDERGRRWYASYELENGECLLQLPPTGSFLLQPRLGRVTVAPTGGDAELLEHRIVSSAICTLLSMREDLVLHAAAVEVDERAVLFCGPSQRGKSTLVRRLGRAGHSVLGEDGIAIALDADGPVAHPGARGVRMRSAEGRPGRVKLIGDPGPGEPAAAPVGAIVLLRERSRDLAIEPLPPARALALLTPNLVHSGSRAAIATAFQRHATLLGSTPAFAVALPDDLDALAVSAARLLDAIAAGG